MQFEKMIKISVYIQLSVTIEIQYTNLNIKYKVVEYYLKTHLEQRIGYPVPVRTAQSPPLSSLNCSSSRYAGQERLLLG